MRSAHQHRPFDQNDARARASRGNRVEAQRLLARVMAARVVPAYDVAKIHLALGDHAKALRWLERAYEMRSHSMLFLGIDPEMASLRGDASFDALVKKVATSIISAPH